MDASTASPVLAPASSTKEIHRNHHENGISNSNVVSSSSSSTSIEGGPSYFKRAETCDSFDESVANTGGHSTPMMANDSDAAALDFLPALRAAGRTLLSVERRNDRLARTLRVTQKELKVVGGNKIQTRIEVMDNYLPSCPIVFSVKHTHGNPWGRQMIVHKNLLLACILAGVTDPPLEIPKDSQRMFSNTENIPHMHSYMERVLPHIRYPDGAPPGVRLYWWRAVENGATVLQNESTGRLIVIPNRDKRLTGAADTVLKCLAVMRNLATLQHSKDGSVPTNMPGGTFLITDPQYPLGVPASKLAHIPDPNRVLSLDELKEAVQRWAVDHQVSPWMTQMVVRTRGLRKSQVTNIRYSLDVDPGDTKSLSMQVHSNEPLSRELQAFPVCMVPMQITEGTSLQNVYLRFLQALWFLKKLFDFHQEVEAGSTKRSSTDAQPGRSQSALRGAYTSSVARAPTTRGNYTPGPHTSYPSSHQQHQQPSFAANFSSDLGTRNGRSPSTPRTAGLSGSTRPSVSPLPSSNVSPRPVTPSRRTAIPRNMSTPVEAARSNGYIGPTRTGSMRQPTPSKNQMDRYGSARYSTPSTPAPHVAQQSRSINPVPEFEEEGQGLLSTAELNHSSSQQQQHTSPAGSTPNEERPRTPPRPRRQSRQFSALHR